MGVAIAENGAARQRLSLTGDTSCIVLWGSASMQMPAPEVRAHLMPQSAPVIPEELYPSSAEVAIAKGFRIMTEESPRHSTFAARDKQYDGALTRPRAREAFTAYIGHRDWSDQQVERKRLQCEMQQRVVKGDQRGAADIRQRLKSNGLVDAQGGEALLYCGDYDEARERAVELVGPVDVTTVRFTEPKFGVYGDIKRNGGVLPMSGFVAEVPTPDGRGTDELEWRMDYCADKQMCHINVKVRPPKLNGVVDHYNDKSPNTLDVAFLFPNGEPFYHAALAGINDRLMGAWVEAEEAKANGVIFGDLALDYMPHGSDLLH